MKQGLLLSLLFTLLSLAVATAGRAELGNTALVNGATRVNAEQLLELLNNQTDTTLIDARSPVDRKHGYIEGSISLPNYETSCLSLDELTQSRAAPIAFYCNGIKCGRSAVSAGIAIDCGYSSVYWFRGGIEEWKQRHYPLVQ